MAYYATNSDLDRLFNNFTLEYYGTFLNDDTTQGTIFASAQAEIDRDLQVSSKFIDSKLAGLGYRTPVSKVNGTYDIFLTEWCAYMTIYRRLVRNHAPSISSDEIPDWIKSFADFAKEIEDGIVEGNLILDIDISAEESGIGHVYVGGTSGSAYIENNRLYGGAYRSTDYKGRVVVQIDGTSGGNTIGKATFKWSKDGGYSYEDTGITTSTAWISLFDGVKIRFVNVGTNTDQLQLDDWWYFDVIPVNMPTKRHKGIVNVKYFGRG